MAIQLNIHFVLLIFAILARSQLFGHAQVPLLTVPCYFAFGDSLVDNGNNNLLKTKAKANYLPYGVDYPSGPTGRFSNGLNLADFIAESFGINEHIPPYASVYAGGPVILKGVNYGSGAAGIRDETGQHLGDRISFNQQLENHKHVVSLIDTLLGSEAASYLKTCVYTVGFGSDDYLNNYLMPKYYNTSNLYTPTDYATAVIQQYSEQLTTLYSTGARKIAVFGLGLLGCIPHGIDSSGCSNEVNTVTQLFETKLRPLVDTLNNNLTGARFTFINVTHISLTPVPNTGLIVVNRSCCVVSTIGAAGLCKPKSIPCRYRNTNAFFDDLHPSEHVSQLKVRRAFKALTELDASPYDINTLAQMEL